MWEIRSRVVAVCSRIVVPTALVALGSCVGACTQEVQTGEITEAVAWSLMSNDVVETEGESAAAVAVDGSGNIVVAGNGSTDTGNQIIVMRYLDSGDLDDSFGSYGIALIEVPATRDARLTAIALDQQGRIVIAGYGTPEDPSDSSANVLLGRLRDDGTPDLSFGGDGFRLGDLEKLDDEKAMSMKLDKWGRVIVAGTGDLEGTPQGFVARFLDDGALDASFNSNGYTHTEDVGVKTSFLSVAVDKFNRIAAGGEQGQNFCVMRVRGDGLPDTSFGPGGLQRTDIGATSAETVSAIGIDPTSERIVAAGWGFVPGEGRRFLVARYDHAGALDPAYGDGGVTMTDTGASKHELLTSMAIDEKGRVTVAGHLSIDPIGSLILARYGADGKPDTPYGVGGLVVSDIVLAGKETANALTLDDKGRAVVAGAGTFNGSRQVLVARFDVPGTRDLTFGSENVSADRTGVWRMQLRLRYWWDIDWTGFMRGAHDTIRARVRIGTGGPWYLGNSSPNFYVSHVGGSNEETFELSPRALGVKTLDDLDGMHIEVEEGESGSAWQSLAITETELIVNGETVFLDDGNYRFRRSADVSRVTFTPAEMHANPMWPEPGDNALCNAPETLSETYLVNILDAAIHNQIMEGRWVEDLNVRQYVPSEVWPREDHLRVRLNLRYARTIAFDSAPRVDVEFDVGWDCSNGKLRATTTNVTADVDLSEISFLFVNTSAMESDIARGVRNNLTTLQMALSPQQRFPECPNVAYMDAPSTQVQFDFGSYSPMSLMCRSLL